MKKLLIGLLALGSISSFASTDCSISISGNMKDSRVSLIGKILESKDYVVTTASESIYKIAVNGMQPMFQEGDGTVVEVQLKNSNTGKIEHKSKYSGVNVFNRWNKRVKDLLSDVPACK
jgi:hypothetical protein